MQILQRIVLIAGTVLLFLLSVSAVSRQTKEKFREQREQILINRFLSKTSRTGYFSFTEYQQLCMGLKSDDIVVGIEIDEFRKEQDVNGKDYYYLVLWKDRTSDFLEEEYCWFRKESIICVRVKRENRKGISDRTYWEIVAGRES